MNINCNYSEYLIEFIKKLKNKNIEYDRSCLKRIKNVSNIDLLHEQQNYIQKTKDKFDLFCLDSNKEKISFIILTYNEERAIKRCIESIISLADEIIVIDSQSSDRTLDIIKSLNSDIIYIYSIKWINDFSYARNVGIDKASGDWIFFIDADEYIEDSISYEEIRNLFTVFSSTLYYDKFYLCPTISDIFSENVLDNIPRIFMKSQKLRYYGMVHEEIRNNNQDISLLEIHINILIKHDGYIPQILKSKNKLKRNITLLKIMIEIEPNNSRWKYFFVRDSFFNRDSNLVYLKEILLSFLLKDKSKLLQKSNIVMNSYTVMSIDLLCRIEIALQNYDSVKLLSSYLLEINPNSTNAIYYKTLSELLFYKLKSKKLLNDIVQFRKQHFEDQPNAISTKGYHLDLLIAILLFENMNYSQSKKYFAFVKDKFNDEEFQVNIQNYLNVIDNIKGE